MSETSFFASADTHTMASGSVWAVHVQPQFADQVFEAAHLLTRPTPAGPSAAPTSKAASVAPPSEFALALRNKAEKTLPTPLPAEVDGDGAEEGRTQQAAEPKPDTEEVKAAKRKLVEELWTKVRPGCFGRADDRELDAVNNLLISLLIGVLPPSASQLRPFATQLLEALTTAEGRVTPYGRYNALVTLFNALPAPTPSLEQPEPPLQLTILLRLASLSAAHSDDLSITSPSLLRLPVYLSSWNLVSSAVGADAVAQVANTLAKHDRPEDAFGLALGYLRLPGSLSDPVSGIAIKLGLALPDFFDWQTLETLEPVKAFLDSNATSAQAKALRALDEGKVEGVKWALQGDETFDDAAKERIEKKAKLLSLAELCGRRVGGEVSYEEVRQVLGLQGTIEEDDGMEVEEWVINAIKAKLISARLHQPTHLISVTTSTSRNFASPQWQTLLSRLQSWSSSLHSLVVAVERSLPAGQKTTGVEKEKTLEGKEGEARAAKDEVVRQVEKEVKTAAPVSASA